MYYTEDDWNSIKNKICDTVKEYINELESCPISFDDFYINSIKKIDDAFGNNYTLKCELMILLMALTSNPETACENDFIVIRSVMDFLDNLNNYINDNKKTIETLTKLLSESKNDLNN